MSEEAEILQEVNPEDQERPDDNILDVRDLKVWFELRRLGFGHAGYVHAVDGVNFKLERGEAIAIVGESGCGKTSLMKTILGLNEITDGEIFYNDRRLNDMDAKTLRWFRSSQIGYVQQ